MTDKRFFFDIETRCGLGVAAHAAMCADATLTPDQAISIARHEVMEASDQLMFYAGAAGIDTVVLMVGDSHFKDGCPYLGIDHGYDRDIVVVHGGDLMQYDRRLIPLEPRMFKMLEPRVLRQDEPPAVVPRKGKKRDWEQRNRKQKRR